MTTENNSSCGGYNDCGKCGKPTYWPGHLPLGQSLCDCYSYPEDREVFEKWLRETVRDRVLFNQPPILPSTNITVTIPELQEVIVLLREYLKILHTTKAKNEK